MSERANNALGAQPTLSGRNQLQVSYFDAVRRGDDDSAQRLASTSVGAGLWRVRWASSTDLDPRLRVKLQVGAVTALACGVVEEQLLVAVCTSEPGGVDGSRYRLEVHNLLDGWSRELGCGESIRRMAFARSGGRCLLVSAHRGGLIKVWNLADSALCTAIDTDGGDVRELYVVQRADEAELVTQDVRGHIARWSLPDGGPLGALDTAWPHRMSAGRLVDGRHVLVLSNRAGLALWDLDGDVRLPLKVPHGLKEVRSSVLSVAAGRDCLTVLEEYGSILTFDPATGEALNTPITAHVKRPTNALMHIWGDPYPYPSLAVVAGVLAVPTRGRVRLWDLATSRQCPALTGPVAGSLVTSVAWQGRDLLLTGSTQDGLVALWDLDLPVAREPGHDEHVAQVTVARPADVVVSVDEGGTLVARHGADGQVVLPLATGIHGTRSLAAWTVDGDVLAATGAGSRLIPDGRLWRWNVTTGDPAGPPVSAHRIYVHWLSRGHMPDGETLITYGTEGVLKVWRAGDGDLLTEIRTEMPGAASGFVTGIVDSRPVAVLSFRNRPISLYFLDDPDAAPTVFTEALGDVVLDLFSGNVVTAHVDVDVDVDRTAPTTIRVRDAAGSRIGPDVRGSAEVVAAAGRVWPATYIGRADGTVSLVDLETGQELCPPMPLPDRPVSLAVVGDGDLVVGFGSDVACVRPPAH